MTRWSSFGFGALTFAGAHFLEAALWRQLFDPADAYPPWFLNNGRAATLVVVSLFLAGVVVGVAGRRGGQEAFRNGCCLATGALAAMAVVLFTTGPGTIFPIVLVFGALIAGVSGIAGALVGTMISGTWSDV